VPRSWTSLDRRVHRRPARRGHAHPSGLAGALERCWSALPETIGEGTTPALQRWDPGGETFLDRSIAATRRGAFPLLGLDPDDPRD
jgi:acetoin utilization protein AcuC